MRRHSILGVLASFVFLWACEKQPDSIPVTGITLEPASVELVSGESITITATVSPDDATNKKVKWTSSNPSILVSAGTISTLFEQGAPTTLVNGKPALGQGTITATTEDGGKVAKCQVTVYAKVVAVTGIRLSESSLQLARGESHVLTATVLPDNAKDKAVQWSSSDSSVASVNQNGTVAAVGVGEATITASAGDFSAACSVHVSIPVASISLDSNLLYLKKGAVTVLTATVSPDDATDKTVQWSSSNPSVATVDQNGSVTAVDAGNAVITASAGGFTASCTVYCMVVPVTAVVIDKKSLSLERGASETLAATVLPNDATDRTVLWSSNNPSVASVDQNGQVTAVDRGDAIITASVGDVSATCAVSVFVPVTSITLNSTNLTLTVGETALLEATVLPDDADDNNVRWYSSCPEVLSVEGGRITALDFGQAVITAQVGGLTASCSVTVLIDLPSGVIAEYVGGDASSSGGFVGPGSHLVFCVTNLSTETITVKSVQLFDEVSGGGADIIPLGSDLGTGVAHQWTIDVPEAGIHSPTAVFTFTYRGDEHTCSAKYSEFTIRIKSRP